MNYPIVRLVSCTAPADGKTLDQEIEYIARVSNPKNQDKKLNDTGTLISYLVKHQHWSPFEMVSATLEIVTSRAIARQILRHRSFSFQEFSQRYAATGADVTLLSELRKQARTNRQSSTETIDALDETLQEKMLSCVESVEKLYKELVSKGVAKEQARFFLPEGLTPSRLYMAGTLRSWIHYVNLRTQPDTQQEHREIAIKVAQVLKEAAPITFSWACPLADAGA